MENNDLNNEYKKNPFNVPNGYFEGFNQTVFDKIQKEKSTPFSFWKRSALKIAASVALIAGMSYFFYNQRDNSNELTFESINEEELAQFENEIEISDDEFEEIINEEFIDSLYKVEFATIDTKSEEISALEIEELEEEYDPLDEDEIEI